MRKVVGWILGAIIILFAVFFAIRLIEGKKRPEGTTEKIVKTAFVDTVNNSTIPVVIPVNGSLNAMRKVELYSEVQGIFESGSRLFKAGENYRKGETIIKIDGSEFYASIRSRRSDLFNLITGAMPDLRLDYPEVYPKWKKYHAELDMNKSIPELPEFESEQEKYYITSQGIIQTYYSIKNLEERYSKYRLLAPFNGVLTEALVNPGTLIRPGQKLGEFIDPSAYEMEVSVNKSFLEFLVAGKKVNVTNLENTESWQGTLVRVNGKIDQATQSVKVFIRVLGEGLREGMYLQAILMAAEQSDVIEVDRKLLVDESKIFLVKDSILQLTPIEPLYFSEKKVIIRGLKNGDLILERTIPGAYNGMLVEIYEQEK